MYFLKIRSYSTLDLLITTKQNGFLKIRSHTTLELPMITTTMELRNPSTGDKGGEQEEK